MRTGTLCFLFRVDSLSRFLFPAWRGRRKHRNGQRAILTVVAEFAVTQLS